MDGWESDEVSGDPGGAERDGWVDSYRWLAVVGLFVSLFLRAEERTVTVFGIQAFVFSLVAVVSPPTLAESGPLLTSGGVANLAFFVSCLWWVLGSRSPRWGQIATWWVYAVAVLNLGIFGFLYRGLLEGFYLWLAAHVAMLLASAMALWLRR